MKDIAILLKALNIYAHNAHQLASRIAFIPDHEFLAEIYEAADTNYDAVIERIIGLMGTEGLNLDEINMLAVKKSASVGLGADNAAKLTGCMALEKQICAAIGELVKSGAVSIGTEQLLGDICDKSEVRQYKLRQRLVK
jgi:DNA-binding ferritin-like protein